jgi:N-acetylglucosaminyl-diphospho-decaprenol L-rhamnosyltransferase
VDPTVLEVGDPHSPFRTEELFAPVLTAYVYDDADWEKTLHLVDESTPYGLTGAVFAEDGSAVAQAAEALRYTAGNFYVNDKPTGSVVGRQPFGGARASGTNDKAGTVRNLARFAGPRTTKRNHPPVLDYRYPTWRAEPRRRPTAAGRLCRARRNRVHPAHSRSVRFSRSRGEHVSPGEPSALAVVVSFGATKQLHDLLAALAAVRGCDVVLVENKPGVDHGPVPDGVTVLAGHGNVGYGVAVNLAVEWTRQRRGLPEWLLVVNSDVVLPAGTRVMLPVLLQEARHEADVLAFPLCEADGTPGRSMGILPSVRATVFTTIRGEKAALRRWPQDSYPVGAFFAIRCETFLAVGGFDPAFWMYFEETDLFTRLRVLGARTTWVSNAWPVLHAGGETTAGATLMHVELGRSAAIYARAHRDRLGRAWPYVFAVQHVALTARRLVTGRWGDAARAVRILRGVLRGKASPRWEPAVRVPYRAVPHETRVLMNAGAKD